MKKPRWTKRPTNSTWGDWGMNDQLGRLNLIGPEQVKNGIKEVKEGKTFCLSLPLNLPGGNVLNTSRFPPILSPVIRNGTPYYNFEWGKIDGRLTDIASDDSVLLHTQYSTQWDGLAHRGSLFDVYDDNKKIPVYYNGFRSGEDVVCKNNKEVSADALGIENMAKHGVQSRGVLINLYKHFGEFPRKEVGYNDLMKVLELDKISIEPGDILCFWTGFDRLIINAKGKPDKKLLKSCATLDGWDKKLLQWITDCGVSAIASDNLAIESTGKTIPENYTGSNLPLHEHCLFKLGVHLGELWMLEELAQWLETHNRSKFLLTAPPLRLPGAIGSPVCPIATV